MIKDWVLPSPFLRPFIDRFWYWEGETELPCLLPGTGNELCFHYRDPFVFITEQGESLKAPKGHLMMPRHGHYFVVNSGKTGFISARFRSGAFRQFCGVAMNELADTFPSCQDLWGYEGTYLTEQVCSAVDFPERVQRIEKFLIHQLGVYQHSEIWLNQAIDHLYYHFVSEKVEDVAEVLPVTKRQVERKFMEYIGVTPKSFQKVARFQSVLKTLLLQNNSDYLKIALDAGYWDQAHFIHDFHCLTGQSPQKFLNQHNFMSHFYNKSRQELC